MFKKSIFSLALFVLSLNSAFSQSSPTTSPNLPLGSVAYSDDIWAIQYNPAGLGVARGWQLYYTHAYSDSSFKGDNGIFMSAGGLGFSSEWLGTQNSTTYRKYSLAYGLKLDQRFFMGSSYSWFSSKNQDLDKLSSWNAGIIFRANQYLSLGALVSDLNRPTYLNQKTDIGFNYGVSFRPWQDRLTLAVEGFSTEKQRLKDTRLTYKLEAEPTDGLILYGLLDQDKNYGLGVRFNLTNFCLGSFNFFAKKGGMQNGVGYMGFSKDRFRTRMQRKNNLLKMRLAGDIPEENRSGAFLAKKRTLFQVLNQIQKAREDKTISGLILRIDNLAIGWAKVQELRDALYDFKSSAKKIYVFMESGGNKEYYLATLADKIIMLPTGDLNFTGLAAEVTFYKKTLDKLGVVADLEHIGDYKNASDLLTRESMSDAHREVVNSVLDDIYSQILQDIAQARNLTVEEVKDKINQGPYTALEAKKTGLVDELAFYDEVKEIAEEKENKNFLTLSENRYSKQTEWGYSWFIPPKIALIYATGEIVSGRSGRDFLFGNTMGSETIADAIKKAREDNKIKAVVLRVDSPGGSGIASDVIWRELVLTKRKKPLIVSMSDVAASGGYFIACPGDYILAQPGTITGSIGVISGKVSLQGLYQKIGFSKEIVKRGAHADFYTTTRTFSDEEREIVRRQIKQFYSDFVDKVASGRKLPFAYVDGIAQGRVWTGNQALQNKLVDEFGGINLALALAKEKAGIPDESAVQIVTLPRYRRFFPLFGSELYSVFSKFKEASQILSGESAFSDENILYLAPYEIEVK